VSLYEAVSVPVGGWGGDTVYETVYEEVSTEETHTEVGVMCQTPGGSRQPVEHRIRGLTAYTEYLVRVRSRSYDEQNGPLSDVEESPELVVRAGVTPKGSGREQRDRSGLQTSLDRKKTMYHPDQTRHYQMGLFDRHPGQDTEFTGESWNQMDKRGSIAFDPDGDGNLDLFFVIAKTCFPGAGGETCIDYENVLFQNNGSGWFYTYGYFETSGPQPLPDTKRDSRAAVAGDFDGDGFVDLFVVNFDEENELLLNDGTGNFSLSEEAGDVVTTTERSVDVVAGDFDGDGFVDLFVVNYGAVNELFWNDGAGSFTLDDNPDSPLTNEVTYSWTVIAADFNGDGYLDIFEVCSTSFSSSMPNHDTTNRLYVSDGSGGFTLSSDPEAMGPDDVETRGAVARDFNNDGIIDLYYVNKFQSDTNKLLINDGSGSFTAVGGIDATGKLSSSTSVTSCDIDGDGDQGEVTCLGCAPEVRCSEN